MAPDTKIGDFEILARLGEGGMGEVYRARDTRLGRDVAIKILPAALATDADRLERLSREARMLASLNHPNIAAIYSVETAGPVHALVLELVEGETLGARIRRGPLTVSEARAVGRQIAAALDAAHECGIVHRDLKPENVMIGPRGLVKVLDFGLARTATVAAVDGVTVSAGPTADGAIVGTVAYMSPEQARGLRVDRRADIWAFGCVLYEMLAGRRAFAGATLSDTIVATLEKDPDWSALPPETPPGIRRLLVRTLQKDPHDRLRDIADGIPDLEEASAVTAVPPAKGPATWIPWALAAIAIAAAGWLLLKGARQAPPDPILRSELTPITRDAGISTSPSLSRDGRLLAYASDRAGGGTLDIWVQQVTGGGAIRLTDDEADDTAPDFSPDGREIVFQSDRGGGGAYIVSAFGGAEPRLVARGGREPRFSPDGKRIAYWSGDWRGGARTLSGLYIVSLAGGDPQRIAATWMSARAPVWAPDGQSLLFLGRTGNGTPADDPLDWYWVKLDGSAPVEVGLLEDAALQAGESQPAAWTDDNEVLFSDSRDLWSVSISPDDGRMQASPRRLTVSTGSYRLPAIGGDGRIVFASAQDIRVIERAPLGSPDRPPPPAQLYADFSADTGRPSETRDGSIIVFERQTAAGKEIWTRNVRSGAEQLITRVDTTSGLSATISPDGSRIAYNVGGDAAARGFVVETARGVPSLVCDQCVVAGFLSDERQLLLWAGGTIKVRDVVSGTSRDAVTTAAGVLNRPHVSPDERWIAFRHDRKSFVTPFTPGRPPDRSAWEEIQEPTTTGRPAGWALDSRMVYLLLDTDGFRCLWGQRLDAAGRLDGTPVPVRHFHGADWAALSTSFGNPITPEGFLYATIRPRGNIWSLVRPPVSSQELTK